jgi:hypothetical protein
MLQVTAEERREVSLFGSQHSASQEATGSAAQNNISAAQRSTAQKRCSAAQQ